MILLKSFCWPVRRSRRSYLAEPMLNGCKRTIGQNCGHMPALEITFPSIGKNIETHKENHYE